MRRAGTSRYRRLRITRRRQSFRRRMPKRVFRPRAMFPLSTVVRLPFRTCGNFVVTAADAKTGIAMSFIANGLSGGVYASSLPRGTYTLCDLIKGPYPTTINVHNNATTGTIQMQYVNGANANTPVAYKHLGNIYRKYRVLGWKASLSLYPNSNYDTSPGYNAQLMVSMFNTIDTDLATASVLPRWVAYRSIPASKTKHMFTTPYDRHGGGHISIHQRAQPLVRDPVYRTSNDWVGTCTQAPAPTTAVPSPDPTYINPPNKLFFGIVIDPVALTASLANTTNTLFSFVLDWTPIVKFYEPHENNDFQNSLL